MLLATMIFISSSPAIAQISDDDRDSIYRGSEWYKPGAGFGGCSPGNGTLPSNIPTVWLNLINGVASKYPSVDPRVVAALLWIEQRGWPEYKTSGWAVSSAGAKGPWQFIEDTWASLGTDGDGDGVKDPDNPKDAVHAAFKHNLGSAGKPIATEGFTGNAAADFNTIVFRRSESNLLFFAAKYNGGPVNEGGEAPDGVILKDFPRNQNADYVIMFYWLLATNFSQGYSFEQGKLIDAGGAGGGVGLCPGDGTVDPNGYSFPVAPQRKSQNGGVPAMSALPCNNASCHHDGSAAFDISRKPGGESIIGTPVYAISAGKTVSIRSSYNGQSGCQSLQLVSSRDEYWYWYGHIQKVLVNENQEVTAGQQIAVIGEVRCTAPAYSAPHLHIDRGSPKGEPGGSVCCRDPGMNALINALFNNLLE